ncbi:MAG: MFS transporter [Rubrobacteraceae bacterium]|nr:MFS transporter [Rubrobacteraceae bacterium]
MRSNYRWTIVILVVLLVVINYVDRSAISYAIGPISKDFGINEAQWGIISGAFSIGYLVIAFFSGPLVDHFGPKRVLGAAIVLWSVVSGLTVVAGAFAALFVVRVLLGVGEGPGFPAATRAASRWLPQKERGRALSLIVGVGVSGSLLIGGPIVTQLIAHLGWKGMFVTLAAAGIVWVVLWLVAFKDSPNDHPRVNEAERSYIAAGQTEEERTVRKEHIEPGKIFSNLNLWAVAFGYFAWGYMFWGFLYWLPGYLGKVYKLDITSVGLFSVLPWAAGVIGTLLGGFIMDAVYARTSRKRPRYVIMGIALLLAGGSMIPIFAAPSLTTSLLFISLGIGFGFITGGFWWVASIDAAPDQPGFAAGFADASFALSGLVAPVVMGFIVQSTGSFNSGFVVMAVLAVLGAAALMLLSKESQLQAGVDREAVHSR